MPPIIAINAGLVGEANRLTVGEPYECVAGSIVHAQFNAPHTASRIRLADGRVDLQTYQKAAIADPRSVAMTRATPTPTVTWKRS